jgi:CarD family transcriptional regulator
MSESAKTFQVHQKVVYPSQGVGKIVEITEKPFKDSLLTYYVIYLEVSDMTVMVPAERIEELGVRPIVPPEEAYAALELMGSSNDPSTSDWKLRYQMNMDLLKKGSVADIATIVRSLYHRNKIKDLSILERKLYDSAKKLLEDEISFSLNLPLKEVEAMIHARLEPGGEIMEEDGIIEDTTDDFDLDVDFGDDDDQETRKRKKDKDSGTDDDDDDDDDEDEEEEEAEEEEDDDDENLD